MDNPASLEACQGELSNFPDMTRTRDRSVICSEPGSFSNVFKMNASYYTQTATEWLEKSDRYDYFHLSEKFKGTVQPVLGNTCIKQASVLSKYFLVPETDFYM